jgi:hypothetical protein
MSAPFRYYAVCADPSGAIWCAESLIAEGQPPDVKAGLYGAAPTIIASPKQLAFLQIAAGAGGAIIAGTTHDKPQHLIVAAVGGGQIDLGPTYGTQQVQLKFDDARGVFALMAIINATTYGWWDLDLSLQVVNTGTGPLPPNIHGTSHGLLGITEQGEPVFTDLNRIITPLPGVKMSLPTYSGWWQQGWLIGQVESGYLVMSPLTEGPVLLTPYFRGKPANSPVPGQVAIAADGSPVVALTGCGILSGTALHPGLPPAESPTPAPNPIPTPGPAPAPAPVPPSSGTPPWAVSRLDVVESVDRDYPHLLERARTEGEEHRAAFVDQVAHRLNRLDQTTRWGRKARRDGDAGSLNDDVVTYLLPGGTANKKLVDVVSGAGQTPIWDLRPTAEEPGNGFWHPPVNPDLDGTPIPEPEPGPGPQPGPTPEQPVPLPDPDQVVELLFARLDTIDARLMTLLQATLGLSQVVQGLTDQVQQLTVAATAARRQTYTGTLALPSFLGGTRVIRIVPDAPQEP